MTGDNERDVDAEDLQRLREENEALQAENEALKLEAKRHATKFEFKEENEELTAEEDEWLRVEVEALRREREALQKLMSLADELQGLERTNLTLREAERQLHEENLRLQSGSRIVGASLPPATQSHTRIPPGTLVGSDGERHEGCLERRLDHLAVSLGHGSKDVLLTATPQQRQEIVGAMLKAGLFNPFGETSHQAAATTAPNERMRAEMVPTPQPASMVFLKAGVSDDVADAVRRGDVRGKDQKDLVANMLKTGLFCAPPGPILATSADERAMDLDLKPSNVTRP